MLVGIGKYSMTLSLNVLNHLGLNLYSSTPAVLSETVANAWDADATQVKITLDVNNELIVIEDDGIGMTADDVNSKFLRVGYLRREDGEAFSPGGRQVMGRKGIGKLAMFGIADEVQVDTVRNGEKCSLRMTIKGIQDSISSGDPSESQVYQPEVLDTSEINFDHGTRITLTSLKRGLGRTAPYLRKRLARRFSVIGPADNFRVFVGDKEVDHEDTQLVPLAEFVWAYGSDEYVDSLRVATGFKGKIFKRSGVVSEGYEVFGWIGSAFTTKALRSDMGGLSGESLNRVPIFVRGKLAQEDLLHEVDDSSVYRNYLLGEIHADFLDVDTESDIATSSRQRMREDDPRYESLVTWLAKELSTIRSEWSDLRNSDGEADARSNPAIDEWFESLGRDSKRRARRLFGKINQLGMDAEDRAQLYAHAVLAFETMAQRENLDQLDAISGEDLVALAKVLDTSADLEAALYHKIVRSRLEVIDKLDDLIADNSKESFLQKHLFTNLWLLDPGWERASVPEMEKRIGSAFKKIEAKIPEEERNSRFDIRYQKTSGQHVIVELKRARVKTSASALLSQVEKYRDALLEHLRDIGKDNESVAVVCVVGKPLKDWDKPGGRKSSADILGSIDARAVQYDELISNAQAAYREYLEDKDTIGRVQRVLDSIIPSDGQP